MDPEPEIIKATEPKLVDAGKVTATTGVVGGSVPSELGFWITQVRRKVEAVFFIPSGLYMDDTENVAEVTFRVSRDGRLLGEPKISKPAADPNLGEAGLQAILLVGQFPPLPDSYPKDEQLVVYAFALSQ